MIEIDVSKCSIQEIYDLCNISNGELLAELQIVRIEGGLDV